MRQYRVVNIYTFVTIAVFSNLELAKASSSALRNSKVVEVEKSDI